MATFTNQATLTYLGVSTLSNIVTGEILDNLAVTKTAVTDTYTTGDALTYVVALTNSGTVPFNNLTLTDNLGAYPFGTSTLVPLTYVAGSVLYFVNGVLQPTPIVTGTSPLTITGITVPAGGDAVIVYSATPNAYAPVGTGAEIVNTVSIGGTGIVTPLTASETVTAANNGNLAITKTMTPTTVTEGDTLTYTLTIENYGTEPIAAVDGAVVTDTFDPILTVTGVTLNGTPLVAGTDYTYNDTTGAFATLSGALPIPGATAVQDPVTGAFTLVPGTATLVISGIV